MEASLPVASSVAEIPGAVLAVLVEREARQSRYGHTPEADDAAPPGYLMRCAHVLALTASDLRSRGREPDDLARARRKAIQTAALCLAEIERIDRALNLTTTNDREPST